MRYVLVLASIAGNSFVTHHGCYVPQFLCTVLYIGSIMCHFLWYMTTQKMVKQYTLCTFSSDSSTVILKWLWTVLQSHLGKLCTHIHSGRYAHNGGPLLQCKAVSVRLFVDQLTLLSENQYTSYDIQENIQVSRLFNIHAAATTPWQMQWIPILQIRTSFSLSPIRVTLGVGNGTRHAPENLPEIFFVLSIWINVVVQIFVYMIPWQHVTYLSAATKSTCNCTNDELYPWNYTETTGENSTKFIFKMRILHILYPLKNSSMQYILLCNKAYYHLYTINRTDSTYSRPEWFIWKWWGIDNIIIKRPYFWFFMWMEWLQQYCTATETAMNHIQWIAFKTQPVHTTHNMHHF